MNKKDKEVLSELIDMLDKTRMKIEEIFDDAVNEASDVLDEMAERYQEVYDSHTGKWQDSDKGEEMQDIIDALEDVDFDQECSSEAILSFIWQIKEVMNN